MNFFSQIAFNKKLIASSTLSFIWVNNYQYKYNVEIFNTHVVNIWAYSLWVIASYVYLKLDSSINNKFANKYISFTLSWAIYFLGLLLLEYIGYNILGIHESSARGGALIFGLIHGNNILHIYYLLFPILITGVYRLFLVLPAGTIKAFNVFRHIPGIINGHR